MPDGMTYDKAKKLLEEVESDLAAVRGWPPDRPNKPAWERAVYERRESLRRIVRRRASAETERVELKELLAGV